jgi:nicotinamide mononucleotide adenylyltransferase
VGGSFKPIHKGHWLLFSRASLECEQVTIFVSLKDRTRPGELEISGEKMKKVWDKFLTPRLPKNVSVHFSESSPVKDIYVSLAMADRSGLSETYAIYSDPEDMKRYTDKKLALFSPRLVEEKVIARKEISRQNTDLISGTLMREFLKTGMIGLFIHNLPNCVQQEGAEIWDLLNEDK